MKIEFWLLIALFSLLIAGCRNYEETISFSAPDGRNIIDITTELQLSNDPDPFWQHISIRDKSIIYPILPGNVYCVSCYEKPQVIWINEDSVILKFNGNTGKSFNRNDLRSKVINGVSITAIIEDEEK
jgi:hypothetical protein